MVPDQIVTMQFPIVFFLAVVSFQAGRAFKEKSFTLVALGWSLNFVYLLVKNKFNILSPAVDPPLESDAWTVFAREISVSLSSALFLIAAHRSLSGALSRLRRISPQLIVVVALGISLAYSLVSIFPFGKTFPYSAILALPSAAFNTVCIVALASFFRAFQGRYLPGSQGQLSLLFTATLTYSSIQFLKCGALAVNSSWAGNLNFVGFLIGLTSKIGIAFGMMGLFVAATVKAREGRARVREARRTVERIAHELGTPISEMILLVRAFTEEAGRRGKMMRLASDLENVLYRVTAIMQAAKKLPLFDPLFLPGLSEETLESDERPAIVSANTLLQASVMSIRATRDEHVIFHYNYAGNSCISCRPAQVIQVLVNLLRNAFDSFPRGEGEVHVSTANDNQADEQKSRIVRISIRDNGEGIPLETRDKIFEEGFTTRGGAGRGYGLAVVRDLVSRNGGTIVLVQPRSSSGSLIPGTEAVLEFPWIACKEV